MLMLIILSVVLQKPEILQHLAPSALCAYKRDNNLQINTTLIT